MMTSPAALWSAILSDDSVPWRSDSINKNAAKNAANRRMEGPE